MQKIGDKIGRTIKVDGTTILISRGKFARVCVEIDITKPLLSKYTLGEMKWSIEYEGIHLVYFNCGIYGHKQEQCDAGRELNERDEGMQEPEPMAAENNGNNLYTPALRKTRESKLLVGEEKYGTWMIVKRKPRRPPRNPEVRSEQRPHSANMKPSGTTKTKVYNNQLFNSRYGSLDDLETEEPESPLAQTPKDPAHTFNAPRQPEPNYNQPVIQYQRKAQTQSNFRGRGGRTNAPRRAAAEEEHTVVWGSLKGKTITREVIHHQLRPPDETSSHVRQPPKPNGLTEEGADFFDCFSPRDAMEEDGGVFLHWLMLRMCIGLIEPFFLFSFLF